MRRMIAWIYSAILGLQLRTHDQHIADLRQMLDELYRAAQHIDAEIEIATDRLLKAQVRRDAAAKRSESVDTSLIGRRLTDSNTISY